MQACLRLLTCSLTIAVLAAVDARAVVAQRDPTGTKPYRDGELIVKFKPGVARASENNLHRKLGSVRIRGFASLRLDHVKLRDGTTVEEAILSYKADPGVEYAEPDYLVSVQATPNDPQFGELWGLHNTGQQGGAIDADIDAPEAWSIDAGSSNVVVAVIDSGIDYNHEDLTANRWVNTAEVPGNGLDDDGNGYIDDVYGINSFLLNGNPWDDNGHGTHVAGIIGATGNNGIGVVGVNWNVKIMSCKSFNSNGVGDISSAIVCLDYVKQMKDRGVNIVATSNSWGWGGGYFSQALYDAIDAQRDILFVAAAGNDGQSNDSTAFYPAAYDLPNLVAVAASDPTDALASFSNFGRGTVHVAAPGTAILSTLPATNYWNIPGGYGYLSGTSMATPHVSGLAALIKSQDPSRDWRAIKNLILSGGDTIPALENKTILGRRINAYGSLSCSNRSALSVIRPPLVSTVGAPVTLKALSIDCGSSVGPVTVTTSAGESFNLSDDGVAPDAAAGDGVFTGTWIPLRDPEKLQLASPAGTAIVTVPPLYIGHYLAEGNKDVSYHQRLTTIGANAPTTWSVVSGALPPGVGLDAATGEISGAPTAMGRFSFAVEVRDAWATSTMRVMSMQVGETPISEALVRTLHEGSGADGRSIALDSSGNIHVLGTLNGKNFIAKYDPSGTLLWLKRYETGYLRALALAGGGFIYAAGGTAIWDTGDTLLVKFDPSGDELWEKHYDNGRRTDLAMDIALDDSGNIFLGGIIEGDHPPSMYVQKCDASGTALWIRVYSAGFADYGYAVGVDGAGNAYLGGSSAIGVPEDWGTSYRYDALIRKYDPVGNLTWSQSYDTGSRYDFLVDLKLDGDGDIYALVNPDEAVYTGFVTTKYSPDGELLWVRNYQSISHQPSALALDSQGNVYAVGASWNEAGHGDWDYLTLKYDGSGNLLGKKVTDAGYFTSVYQGDFARDVAVDASGRVYVAGTSYNGVDGYDMLLLGYSVLPSGVLCAEGDGVVCDDGDACTHIDTCSGGVCLSGSAAACVASDSCHLSGSCSPETGACTYPAKPIGAACDDGNACTTSDVCDVTGSCEGGPPPICYDGNACTADVCDPVAGCYKNVDWDPNSFSFHRIDGRDLQILAGAWNRCLGETGYQAIADLDPVSTPSGACVDERDFHLFMSSFGQSCP